VPEYLRTPDEPRAVNLMDYGMQLGRRFRALKLWFVMRYYGRLGLSEIIDGHCRMAKEFESWVAADPRFEVCAPVHFSLVCFRLRGSDDDNRRLLDSLNASGLAFLSHTVLNGRFVIRMAVGNFRTRIDDLQRVWSKILELVD
jgi:aromatic-L-amino-acid decarboxylase